MVIQFVELFRNSAIHLQAICELRTNIVLALRTGAATATPVAERSIITLTRHIRLFGKFFRRLQQLDAVRFVKLPSCSELVLYYWNKVVQATNSPRDYAEGAFPYHTRPLLNLTSYDIVLDDPTSVYPIRFLVQAMVLFKESLAQWAPVRKDGTENEQGMFTRISTP